MMTGPSRPRRRRGRRGGQRAQQEQPEQQVEESASPERADREQPVGEADESRPAREARMQPDGNEQQGGRDGGGRKRSRSRRRPNRRPAIGPMPTEVLKDSARPAPVAEPLATRTLDAFTVPTGMEFGCPMLTRTRIGLPFAGGRRAPRCAMGWALHGESEALLCMRTPDMLECWKVHPENEAELRATDETENAAD
jgi:hypothetical protein